MWDLGHTIFPGGEDEGWEEEGSEALLLGWVPNNRLSPFSFCHSRGSGPPVLPHLPSWPHSPRAPHPYPHPNPSPTTSKPSSEGGAGPRLAGAALPTLPPPAGEFSRTSPPATPTPREPGPPGPLRTPTGSAPGLGRVPGGATPSPNQLSKSWPRMVKWLAFWETGGAMKQCSACRALLEKI